MICTSREIFNHRLKDGFNLGYNCSGPVDLGWLLRKGNDIARWP